MRLVAFDSIPSICTLKKNDHYFPMVEWFKDPKEVCGWRRVIHSVGRNKDKGKNSVGAELLIGANVDDANDVPDMIAEARQGETASVEGTPRDGAKIEL